MSLVAYDSNSDEEAEKNEFFTLNDNNSKSNVELIENGKAANQAIALRTDFFKLNSSDESDDDSSHVESQKGNDSFAMSSTKDFWADEHCEDWQRPEDIWPATIANNAFTGSYAVAIKTESRKRELKRLNEFSADDAKLFGKRIRQSAHDQQTINSTVDNSLTTTPVYFVHHKVAPLVNQPTAACRVPKTATVTINNAHTAAVNRIVWCSGQYSHLLASASMDKCVKVWSTFSKQQLLARTLSQHEKAVRDVCWSSDCRHLLTASFDKTSRIFDVESGK